MFKRTCKIHCVTLKKFPKTLHFCVLIYKERGWTKVFPNSKATLLTVSVEDAIIQYIRNLHMERQRLIKVFPKG